MPTYTDLKTQAIQIASLCDKVRDKLTTPSKIRYYRENTGELTALLTSSANLRSKAIVIWDMDRAFGTMDILPTRESLMAGRSNNWLSTGDVIGGWISYFADRPRVIDSVGVDGYRWRFMDEQQVRGTGIGPAQIDKFLQSHGWVKFAATDIDGIYTEQESEITALEQFL